jgi:type II secretory pathway component PulF
MMFVSDAGRPEDDRRMGMAKIFQSLSEMLDSAAHSQGRLFSIAVQFFTIGVAGITVGFIVLALFLPLIQLLNDLS